MKMGIVWSSNGISFIELLVSALLIVLVFVAIYRALSVYTLYNVSNLYRFEATKIAQECLELLRNKDFCTNSSSNGLFITDNVTRSFRAVNAKEFTIEYPNPLKLVPNSVNNVFVKVSYKDVDGKIRSISLNSTVFVR